MLIRRAYKCRLYPTKAQEQKLVEHFELCRRLYNKALWWRIGHYRRTGRPVYRKEQIHALVGLKEYDPRYGSVISGVLEDVLTRVDSAFQRFFRRCKIGDKPGFPRPKGQGCYKSITVPRSREFKLKHEGGMRFGRLSFKGFSGLRVRMHRQLPANAKVRRVMIKREADGHWYAILNWDKEKPDLPSKGSESAIGIDLGLKSFIATSEGEHVAAPRHLRQAERKLAKAQRSMSKKRTGSKRRERARRRIARMHAKVRNRRREFLHNASRRLVDCYDVIAVEKLTTANMASNSRIAKSIYDAGWAEFVGMLAYKAESADKSVVLVDPRNTSQECSGCGQLVEKTLAMRVHRCPCGLVLDRDHNAAINVLNRAVRARRGGD